MRRFTLALFSVAITAASHADSEAPQRLSPQGAAAAFSIGRIIQVEAQQDSGLLTGFADLYRRNILTIAATLGGTRNTLPATIVPCEFGGEVELTGTNGLFFTLKAEYRNCATRETGLETKRSGVIGVTLLNLPFVPQRTVAVSFGTAGADFVEERRFVQGSPDEDPVRESLNYRVAGDLFEQDATGAPLTGNFDVLVDGTFFEEQHFFNTGGEPLLGTSLIDANKLRTSGSIRLANEIVDGEQTSIRVTTTQYESGVLTHDIFEEKSEPEFVRKEWVFDDFKLEVGRNTSTDELSQKISGRVRINRPETAEPGCVSGLLQFVTPIRVAETGQDSQQFTSGLMIINDASIRFTADNPGVTIKSPGSDPVQFSDGSSLLGFGNCTY